MSALLGLGGLAGTVVSIILIIIKAIKKQPKKKTVIALGICVGLFIVGLALPTGDKAEAPTPAEALTPTEAPTPTDTPLSFVIIDGEAGEYGKEVVLNAETEFEEHEIAYYIPAGTYFVTNRNTKGSGQVTVFSGGPEYDGEWQHFVADENCARPIVVMAGDTKELVIKEGQFVVLSDRTTNIQFVLK